MSAISVATASVVQLSERSPSARRHSRPALERRRAVPLHRLPPGLLLSPDVRAAAVTGSGSDARIEQFAAPGADGLLFHAIKDPSRQVGSNTVRRHWIKARNAVGRPSMRVHDLRHSGAVLAVRAGATGKETQDRLGHLSAGAADRYQHAARGRDAKIAKK
ncbi:tyrosine-type recombinase/integrase [Calidifontibacter sp. DB0510]|uniref:Tyrosine-type recombinase/integrase n=1 Tax=Metallococcus carri TaxID=1656884 RepID=A0A967E9V6_9MICO|nr:tyrosine-type recombinase/integrase [Metallococcus carri]NHN56807.1 tyrosine-type recombinase/integrase [Metallococcus carri]NOP37816.1 tyrosine-type recombinase/integrase [Calidifontibacter sp. DB2511S]